jgi:hypothetical protein
MIADGGTINFSGKCNKINLTMGEYVMNSPMIAIPMGGAYVVLGIQWLQSLGTMAPKGSKLKQKSSKRFQALAIRSLLSTWCSTFKHQLWCSYCNWNSIDLLYRYASGRIQLIVPYYTPQLNLFESINWL